MTPTAPQDPHGDATHAPGRAWRPGRRWLDTAGYDLHGHGGGFLRDGPYWYLFGECRHDGRRFPGIACYRSRDLLDWEPQGMALEPADDESHDLHTSKIIERPKVIRHDPTGRYVMWIHVERTGYQYARAGVAVADRPEGPYRYLRSFRPNGQESRDMTVFKDDDGRAYLIHSSEGNATQHINLLTDDYLDVTARRERAFVDEWREAPVIFKHAGKYYFLSSGCTGWQPNPSRHAVADSIWGPWRDAGEFAVGPGANSTFRSQPLAVLDVDGTRVYVGDRWNPRRLAESRWVFLPLRVDDQGVRVEWVDAWTPSGKVLEQGTYEERPRGPQVRLGRVQGGRLDTAGPPTLDASGEVEGRPVSLSVWVGWEGGAFHVDAAVRGHGDAGAGQVPAKVFERDNLEIWLDYHQFAVALGADGQAEVAPGAGFDRDGPRHEQATARVRSAVTATVDTDAATGERFYRLRIPTDVLSTSPLAGGRSVALAAVATFTTPQGRQQLTSPADYRWGDIEYFHHATLAG